MPTPMIEIPVVITEFARENPSPRVPRYSISLIKEAGSIYITSKPIIHAGMIKDQLQELFEGLDREAFYVVCLDAKLKAIGVNMVSVGTLSASIVHPREVFKAAILMNAASIICVHNHPSGDPLPSMQDRELTQRLVTAGKLLGIRINDHVIVGENAYYSFTERGIMPIP